MTEDRSNPAVDEAKAQLSACRQELDRARGVLVKAHRREDPVIAKMLEQEARLVKQLESIYRSDSS